MTTKLDTKAQNRIRNTGDVLEITGQSIAGLSLLAGFALFLAGGSVVAFGGVPIGILLMIAGYTKRTSAATMGMFILQAEDAGVVPEGNRHTP
ncbi:hypothetical protein [Arthrobacter rhombi]|uniref:hypothetical protein n=1 Tax=Arthrobacter rhombi TaxID=71253 RepID=UPI003FCF1BB6